MKRNSLLIWMSVFLMVLGPTKIFAREPAPRIRGNGNVIRTSKTLPAFTKISAKAIDYITILKGEKGQNSLVIETDENLIPYVHYEVKNGVLSFSYRDIHPTKLRFYVTVSSLDEIRASGASHIRTADSISGNNLTINASGAGMVRLKTYVKNINLEASGASDVLLAGSCGTLKARVSGAANLKASHIDVDSAYVKASGAAWARVNVSKYLNKDVSGVAHVNLAGASEKIQEQTSQNRVEDLTKEKMETAQRKIKMAQYKMEAMQNKMNHIHFPGDTTRINIGTVNIEVVDNDSTKVKVGNHTLIVGRNGNIWWRRNKSNRFKGHWGGFEMGLNGYVNRSQNANFGKAYDFLTLDYGKSINLNFNIYQQSFALNKAKTLGFITGVGLSFDEYRFSNPVYLDPAAYNLTGYYIVNTSVKKSKLSVHYADIPLILEFQTHNTLRRNRFFIGVGVIGNVKLRSRTKIYFYNSNETYALQDPATGDIVSNNYRTPDQGPRNIVKKSSNYALNPFRFDATVRLGFNWLSLYATYALSPMFQTGRGPDLRQWSAGVTLVKW